MSLTSPSTRASHWFPLRQEALQRCHALMAKNGILRVLRQTAARSRLYCRGTHLQDALAYNPDNIFFSPGDPEQVDATQEAARGVLGRFKSLVSA